MNDSTLALALALALAHTPAHAKAGDLELSLTSEALALVSGTVSATTDDSIAFTPGLRIGWSPVDDLTLLLGWRDITALSRADRGYTLDTSGDALVVGARYSLGLDPVVDLHFEVDLEALHTDFDLAIAGTTATTSAWGFGVVPKLVASAKADVDLFDIDFRLFVGFAARTNHHADGLRLSLEAPASQVSPLDLGSLNLSGVVFGANLAVIF